MNFKKLESVMAAYTSKFETVKSDNSIKLVLEPITIPADILTWVTENNLKHSIDDNLIIHNDNNAKFIFVDKKSITDASIYFKDVITVIFTLFKNSKYDIYFKGLGNGSYMNFVCNFINFDYSVGWGRSKQSEHTISSTGNIGRDIFVEIKLSRYQIGKFDLAKILTGELVLPNDIHTNIINIAEIDNYMGSITINFKIKENLTNFIKKNVGSIVEQSYVTNTITTILNLNIDTIKDKEQTIMTTIKNLQDKIKEHDLMIKYKSILEGKTIEEITEPEIETETKTETGTETKPKKIITWTKEHVQTFIENNVAQTHILWSSPAVQTLALAFPEYSKKFLNFIAKYDSQELATLLLEAEIYE